MPKFRKKPIVVEATQWFKNGDHPEDYANDVVGYEGAHQKTYPAAWCKEHEWEGQVVRYFRRPDVNGEAKCQHCGKIMLNHGWIDTHEGGHIVCPGDWIITGVVGERYPCKPDVFVATYYPA